MPRDLRDRLLAYPLCKHRRDRIVPQRVYMKFSAESIPVVEPPQPVCERGGVRSRTILIDKQQRILDDLSLRFQMPLPQCIQHSGHRPADRYEPWLSILCRPLQQTRSPNTPPAPRHYDAFPPDILPPQRAQFSAPHSCKHHQCKIASVEDGRLLQQSEKTFGFFVCRDLLLPILRFWLSNALCGIVRNDLISLRIIQHHRNHAPIFLHRRLAQFPAAWPRLFSEPLQKILYRYRTKLFQTDLSDLSIHPFQHLPVPGERTGRVMRLPFKPSACIRLKCLFSILRITVLEFLFQFFRCMHHILKHRAPGDLFRNMERLPPYPICRTEKQSV